MMILPILSQADLAADTFEKIAVREGIFAALFFLMLIFAALVFWKLGLAYLEYTKENNDRIATAVETQALTNTAISDIASSISSGIDQVRGDVLTIREAMEIALRAINEPEEKMRHHLIDEARRRLEARSASGR